MCALLVMTVQVVLTHTHASSLCSVIWSGPKGSDAVHLE